MPWVPPPSPPVHPESKVIAADMLNQALSDNTVVILSRMACSASQKIKGLFEDAGIPYYALELDQRADGDALRGALSDMAGSDKTPAVYIRGELVKGYDVKAAYKTGELTHWTTTS